MNSPETVVPGTDDVVLIAERRLRPTITLSVCIPQYGRVDLLSECIRSLGRQSYRDVEICIADDCSPSPGYSQIIAELDATGLDYKIVRQRVNRRYDANLRAAIEIARGKFALLMGNDDRLCLDTALEKFIASLVSETGVGVAVCNFRDYSSKRLHLRVRQSELLAGGVRTARSSYHLFSFVSGVALSMEGVREFRSLEVDGSEMYQTYLATRILASGKSLRLIADVLVEKDVRLGDVCVDSYRTNSAEARDLREYALAMPIRRYVATILAALKHHCDAAEYGGSAFVVAARFYFFTFPYWVVEYRRTAGMRFAREFTRALDPRTCAVVAELRSVSALVGIWLFMGFAGMVVPWRVFGRLEGGFYRLVKWR
jgi:glycosyltransferase involved in cell wall biosynthesis